MIAHSNAYLRRFPESGLQTVPAMELLNEPGLQVKMGGVGGVLGGLSDDLETLGGSMDEMRGDRVHGSSDVDQNAVFYDGTFDDDYTDTRYKR